MSLSIAGCDLFIYQISDTEFPATAKLWICETSDTLSSENASCLHVQVALDIQEECEFSITDM